LLLSNRLYPYFYSHIQRIIYSVKAFLNFSDFFSGGSKFLFSLISWHFKIHRFSKFSDFQNYQIFKPF